MVNGKQKGLSLIELVAAIAIMATLCVLLFTSYKRIRNDAGITKCSGNMRNVMVRISAYAADNNGFMPAFKNPAIGDTWWYYIYSPGGFRDFNREMICPSKDRPNLVYKLAGKYDLEGSYAYNKNIGWVQNPAYPDAAPGKTPKNLLATDNPASLVVLGEWSQNIAPGSRLAFSAWTDILGRHNEGRYASIFFLDGHAEVLDRLSYKESPTTADMLPRTLSPR